MLVNSSLPKNHSEVKPQAKSRELVSVNSWLVLDVTPPDSSVLLTRKTSIPEIYKKGYFCPVCKKVHHGSCQKKIIGELPYCFKCQSCHSGKCKIVEILPSGHRYFSDCLREGNARMIEWALRHEKVKGWFVSMTFKKFIKEVPAKKLLSQWLGRLATGFEQQGGDRLKWVSATEWQKRHVVHFHLVIVGKGLENVSRKRWEFRWESINWNAGHCRTYNADYKAAPYLAKYTSKSRGGELSWGGAWRGLETPNSLRCCCHPNKTGP